MNSDNIFPPYVTTTVHAVVTGHVTRSLSGAIIETSIIMGETQFLDYEQQQETENIF